MPKFPKTDPLEKAIDSVMDPMMDKLGDFLGDKLTDFKKMAVSEMSKTAKSMGPKPGSNRPSTVRRSSIFRRSATISAVW